MRRRSDLSARLAAEDGGQAVAPRRGPAFTLVELLIVISIFVLLLAIGVPAFSSMMYSSEQSMAENALRVAVSAGRDAAVRAGPGRDGALLFIFADERIGMVACVKVATLDDEDPASGPGETVARDMFAPVSGFEPVRLPKGWMVRGYAPPGMIDPPLAQVGTWYEANQGRDYPYDQGNWVFPETEFYNDGHPGGAPPPPFAGCDRQTFMVRFEGGTGMLKNDPSAALVIFPGDDTGYRANNTPWQNYRADQETDAARFVARVLGASAMNLKDRGTLLGDRSVDTILVKAVTELALYNEKKLAGAPGLSGAKIDAVTGCLYRDPGASQWHPAFVPGVAAAPVNAWCEGWDIAQNKAVETDCRLFTVQRYLGTLQEITGTRKAEGVSP
jgi:prepilin-type N-terminal cleavage/methylation domain-containing protein